MLGTGLPGLGTEHCLELSAQGLVPLHWDCAREPKGTGEGPKPHAHALEESMATHSSVLAWRIPLDRGAWRATVLGVKELDMTE